MRGTTVHTNHHHPIRTGLSRRTLYMVPASVAGVAVVGVLLCLPCVHHHQASLFLSPLPFLVLPFGKPGAPAPPPTCGLACGGGGVDADGVASLVLKSLFVVLRAAWKPNSNTASFSFPPSHHYTTTTCTACLLALLLAAIINHDHQGDSMLRRFTAKAGAMARRGSTLPGPGEVACVMHFGRTRAC
jgi:hypothetical protein